MECALENSKQPAPRDGSRKAPGGRPALLTPALQKKLCELVAGGNYLHVAARYVGISKGTLHRWLRRGREKDSGVYRQFRKDVRRAVAHSEVVDVLLLRSLAAKDWRALAWKLSRRFPKRWGNRTSDRSEQTPTATAEQHAADIRRFLKAARDLDNGTAPETQP